MWDADQVYARLAIMTAADPECAAFGADHHRYELGSPLTEAEVVAFEQDHSVTLPDSYRRFLLEIGDGGAGPYYGLYRLYGEGMRADDREDRTMPGHLATPFPHVDHWNAVTFGPDSVMDEFEYEEPKWSAGSLNIAHFGCGAFFRLVITGAARGQVWFDDRAADGGLTPGPDFHDWYLAWLESSSTAGQ